MQKYKDLLRYEQYLLPESKIGTWQGGNTVDGIIQVPFFHYEPKVVEFMDYFQTSDYADHGYGDTMDQKGWFDIKKLQADISIMTSSEILTCLTALIRQDRFCEGFFVGCIEDGTVYALLERLKEFSEIE